MAGMLRLGRNILVAVLAQQRWVLECPGWRARRRLEIGGVWIMAARAGHAHLVMGAAAGDTFCDRLAVTLGAQLAAGVDLHILLGVIFKDRAVAGLAGHATLGAAGRFGVITGRVTL
jgi:hypothetical protein